MGSKAWYWLSTELPWQSWPSRAPTGSQLMNGRASSQTGQRLRSPWGRNPQLLHNRRNSAVLLQDSSAWLIGSGQLKALWLPLRRTNQDRGCPIKPLGLWSSFTRVAERHQKLMASLLKLYPSTYFVSCMHCAPNCILNPFIFLLPFFKMQHVKLKL